jgi:NAD(P)H dehydrogenase (quinone)
MHAHIVFAHPEARSFNGALADIAEETLAAQGITVTRSDLYGERFDTVEGPAHYGERADEAYFSALAEQRHAGNARTRPADVQREIDRLTAADLVILQFPLWCMPSRRYSRAGSTAYSSTANFIPGVGATTKAIFVANARCCP